MKVDSWSKKFGSCCSNRFSPAQRSALFRAVKTQAQGPGKQFASSPLLKANFKDQRCLCFYAKKIRLGGVFFLFSSLLAWQTWDLISLLLLEARQRDYNIARGHQVKPKSQEGKDIERVSLKPSVRERELFKMCLAPYRQRETLGQKIPCFGGGAKNVSPLGSPGVSPAKTKQ